MCTHAWGSHSLAQSDMKFEVFKSGGDAEAVQVTPHLPYEEAAYRYTSTPGMESAEEGAGVDPNASFGSTYEDPNASYEGYDPNASYEGYDPNAESYDPNSSYEGADPNASYAEGYEDPSGWQTHYDDAGTPYYYNPVTEETQWESPF